MRVRAVLAAMLVAGPLVAHPAVPTGAFIAYSLRESANRLASGASATGEIAELGGITDIAGMVYDDRDKDVILVGRRTPAKPRITLDDFVVALRAVFLHQRTPEVSIDGTPETPVTRRQVVRYEGGIEGTRLGRDMVEADVILKKLALAKLAGDLWGVRSYVAMAAAQAEMEGSERHVTSRFWFSNVSPSLAVREGVFAILSLRVGIETEVLAAEVGGKPVPNPSELRDEVGDTFSDQVTANLDNLAAQYPVLARAVPILALVSLAEGVKRIDAEPQMDYWLRTYRVGSVETPTEQELIEDKRELKGARLVLTCRGGVRLNPIVVRLRSGDVTALKEAVLKSRPSGQSLVWNPPLQGWEMPGISSAELEGVSPEAQLASPSFSIESLVHRAGSASPAPFAQTLSSPGQRAALPRFTIQSGLPRQLVSPNVGGVMLSGVATVGEGPSKVDLTDGNFSLVVNGENARLDPQMYRKFVTALWTVYFGRQDPGISIDPIYVDPETGGFSQKHLVRYIGRVVNTDLGRVMREADYQMKKWSVGTERADVLGFKSPDQIAGRSGIRYLSLSRFWLVPEDMRFKSTNNMLLFDSGRMAVKTEVLGTSDEERRADPHNEQFARFFTDHYGDISQKHPIYQELFDHAKLVALAKYLKESGVPLFWFLMANKDLVLTEDSPGTVDNLAKGSDYWKGLTIQGGVDLATKGRYMFDAAALKAVNDAVEKLGTRSQPSTSVTSSRPQTVARPFSFGLGPEKYSVAPQHALSAGKDRHGTLYQTDIALRAEGYIVTPDLIDSLRVEMIRQIARRTLAPAIEKMPEAELRVKLDALVAPAIEKARREVEPLLTNLSSLKNREFKTEAECARAWDDAVGPGGVAEWKPYFVKQAHYATDLELVRYFKPGVQEGGEFGKGWRLLIPYRVRPADRTPVKFLNAMVPRQMAVENLLTGAREALTFSTDRYAVAGYVPDRVESSGFVGLFLLSDASFRLIDKVGSEFQFDQAGYLTDFMLSEDHRVHIEYADDTIETFDRQPYALEVAGDEKVDFLNARIPTRLRVLDLVHNVGEVLTFSRAGEVAGYMPANAATSRFKILGLLSDASFELLDANGNTVRFGPSGAFESMGTGADSRIAKSIRMGHHMVSFSYTIDARGRVVIAASRLSKETEGAEATHVVRYEYDAEGRLTRADKGASGAGAPDGNAMASRAPGPMKAKPAAVRIR